MPDLNSIRVAVQRSRDAYINVLASHEALLQAVIAQDPLQLTAVEAIRAEYAIGVGTSMQQPVTVTLNDDQIKALPTAPVQIADGIVAKELLLVCGLWRTAFTVGYTNVDPDAFAWLGDDDGDYKSCIIKGISSYWADTAPSKVQLFPYALWNQTTYDGTRPIVSQSYVTADGRPMFLMVDNHSMGNFTGGDASNTLDITFIYAPV